MNMKRTLIAALLAAVVAPALTGCVAAVVGGATAGTLAVLDRRTFGIQTEDETIEWKVRGAIAKKFGDTVHVNQTSYNRKVLLTGEAPNEEVKAELTRYAAAQTNVGEVWNEVVVGPTTPFSARSNDAYITSKVKARFVDGNRFRANLVKVVTEARTVFLLGLVTQAEADAAIEIARTTADVKKVVNLLEIVTPARAKELDLPPPDASKTQQPAPVQGS